MTCPTSRRCRGWSRSPTAPTWMCDDGQVADYIPALAEASPDLFGIAIVGVRGRAAGVGDSTHPFTIQSVVKPFLFALVCEALGHREVRERLGVNATGLPVRLGDGGRAGRRRADQPAGQLRRHRHHQPRPRADRRAEVGASCARGSRGSPAASSSSTRRCSSPSGPRTAATRRWRGCSSGTAGIYFDPDEATDVYTRLCSPAGHRRGPRADGRDARGRRGQPGHPAPRGQPGHLPPHLGGDAHRRALRALGGLALRDRAARPRAG